jgi:hypothetical protein
MSGLGFAVTSYLVRVYIRREEQVNKTMTRLLSQDDGSHLAPQMLRPESSRSHTCLVVLSISVSTGAGHHLHRKIGSEDLHASVSK